MSLADPPKTGFADEVNDANRSADLREVVIVAHRAGNEIATAREAAQAGHVVEADVHLFRGRVELRHEKVLWPFKRLWERWFLLPASAPRLHLEDLVDAIDVDTMLLLDLKCFSRRAARRIRSVVPAAMTATVSSRSWWTLGAFADQPETTALRSCGNRAQLWLAIRWPGLGDSLGITAHERLLTPEIVERIRRRTPHVYSWALTSIARTEALARAGLSGAVLDDPSILRR